METNNRFGTFSSSNIWKLMTLDKKGVSFGAPGLKYIKQIKYENQLGRPLNKDFDSKPTLWGKLNESFVFNKLSIAYSLISKERLFHPKIKFWSGAPDLINEDEKVVGDIKCPYSLEIFCEKIKSLENIEIYKKEFPEDYWQHISNAILFEENGVEIKFFEAIIYVPYFSELPEIREHALRIDYNNKNYNEFAWINKSMDYEIPYLIDGGKFYKNLNVLRWEVLESDKNLLTEKVLKAGKLLNEK